jgi:hypothetical protein
LARIDFESSEKWMEHLEEDLGPVVVAKAVLEPQGKWEAARADLLDLYARFNVATDGTLDSPAEYLLTIVSVSDG